MVAENLSSFFQYWPNQRFMVNFQVDQSQILKMFHTSMLMQGLLFQLKHIYIQCIVQEVINLHMRFHS